MKGNLTRVVLAVPLLGFIVIGLLLFTGHDGFAIKISNYVFFILSLGIVVSHINNDQK